MWAVRRYLRRQVRKRPPLPLAGLDPNKAQRVLLINSTALGDLLFSTPAIRALKETYPHWRLDLLVNPRYAALAQHNPHLERLIPFPGRSWGLLSLMAKLKRDPYDLAIILHGNDPEATLVAWAAGNRYLIGSGGSPLSFAYSAGVERKDPFQHAIERRLDFVRLLGADTPDKRMQLFLPSRELIRAEVLTIRHFGDNPSLLVALHPFGSGRYKWWPLESYAALGNHLHETYGAAILIISGPGDRKEAEALAARLAGPVLVTGGRPLLEVAAFLKHCRLFVGNDSGPLHLALALGVPGIALLGADHPRRIGPYAVEWGAFLYRKEDFCPQEHCLNQKCPDNKCLQAITVAEVAALIRTWWEPGFKGKR
ncbi:MAG: glycosyltransferase family 9 protein [Deltaproteobacteria bacterium]|nr:MAG: glycosyltransferase family 9 protein [Deltaproteobacteria bacterium]